MKAFLSFLSKALLTIGVTIVVIALACEDDPDKDLSIACIMGYKAVLAIVGFAIIYLGSLLRRNWRKPRFHHCERRPLISL